MPWYESRIEPLITQQQIAQRCAELGQRISQDYAGEELVMVGVLNGCFLFMADLCRHVKLPCSVDFLGVSSYGDSTSSSGVVKITHDLTRPVGDKHVLLVEDIVDTGLTMQYLLKNLSTRGPRSLKICTLLYKKHAANEHNLNIDYVGFHIPPEFVIGYGLDYMQKYRNLDFIGVMKDV